MLRIAHQVILRFTLLSAASSRSAWSASSTIGTIFPVRKRNPKQGDAYHVPYRSI